MSNEERKTAPMANITNLDIDLLGEVYDQLIGDEPPTIDDWKAKDVENSPVAWMNQFLNGGPLEDFDRFVLTADLDPAREDGDPYADDHRSIDFSPVVWSLLLKEARNLPSDEKLEFYLKRRETGILLERPSGRRADGRIQQRRRRATELNVLAGVRRHRQQRPAP